MRKDDNLFGMIICLALRAVNWERKQIRPLGSRKIYRSTTEIIIPQENIVIDCTWMLTDVHEGCFLDFVPRCLGPTRNTSQISW